VHEFKEVMSLRNTYEEIYIQLGIHIKGIYY